MCSKPLLNASSMPSINKPQPLNDLAVSGKVQDVNISEKERLLSHQPDLLKESN